MDIYTHNPDGIRRSKTVEDMYGLTTVYHIWDGANIVMEYTDTDETKYIRGLNLLAKVDGNGNKTRYVYNAHGDVTALVNDNNAVIKEYDYDAFGNEKNINPTDTNPFRYCGEYYDSETGYVYLRNRYYDPSNGRFITEDPIQDGTNWYAYCSNNPIMFIDPWGLAPTPVEAAAMADHIYDWEKDSDRDDRKVAGWRLIDVWRGRESMKMGFYIPENDDWRNPSEYVVAFRGTDKLLSNEGKNDIEAVLSGKSADMWDAMNYSLGFVRSIGNTEVTFVGHSKGGGEAIVAAAYTDKNAITFNAANFKFNKYVSGKGKGEILNYYVKGEILEQVIGIPTIGTPCPLPTKYKPIITKTDTTKDIIAKWLSAALKNHSIETVRMQLQTGKGGY